VGDCWLVSSIAAVAEFEQLIQNLFVTKTPDERGQVDIRCESQT
jgi:hypothetical protein